MYVPVGHQHICFGEKGVCSNPFPNLGFVVCLFTVVYLGYSSCIFIRYVVCLSFSQSLW